VSERLRRAICERCGHEVLAEALRCASCGAPFQGHKSARPLIATVECCADDMQVEEERLPLRTPCLRFRITPKS